jgi:hypothetical protein
VNAEQLRQLSEIFKDEIEGAEKGVSTAETLRRISDRIMEIAAADGEEEDEEEDASGTFRVGDVVQATMDIEGSTPERFVPKGTSGTVTAAAGDDWVTVRFEGCGRDWRCHVAEVTQVT